MSGCGVDAGVKGVQAVVVAELNSFGGDEDGGSGGGTYGGGGWTGWRGVWIKLVGG